LQADNKPVSLLNKSVATFGAIDIKKIEFYAKPPSRKELNKAQEKNTCKEMAFQLSFLPAWRLCGFA